MRSIRLRQALPWIGLALLTGCGPEISNPATVNACNSLTLQSYTTAQQNQVADEMGAAPAAAEWPAFVTDYGRLRSAVRACQSVRK